MKNIRLKRVYEPAERKDGRRILVDRLWPRGLAKEKAAIDYWARDVAPSAELRRWYGHEPDKWPEFRRRYAAELEANPGAVRTLLDQMKTGTVTFVFAAKEPEHNNATALLEYLRKRGKR